MIVLELAEVRTVIRHKTSVRISRGENCDKT